MQKTTVTIILTIMLGVGLIGLLSRKKASQPNQKVLTIGVLQTASHPALDAARDGFIEEIKASYGDKVTFDIQNAQGSVPNAYALAQRFHASSHIDAIFAIATPAAQAIASIEKEKPIFIAAVTDPNILGFVHPTTNITGSSDMVNVADLINVIQDLTPQAKKIGIIYNIAEVNSKIVAEKMKLRLKEVGLLPVDVSVASETDLGPALQSAFRRIDALLAPTDNMVASALTFISQQALQKKIPLFISFSVESDALAACGVNYKAGGKQAAEQALQVLQHGKKPCEIAFAYPKQSKILINKQTFTALNLTIPTTMMATIELIGDHNDNQ